MEISFSFGLGFVERSHKTLNCWGYECKTPMCKTPTLLNVIIVVIELI